VALTRGPRILGGVSFDVQTLVFSSGFFLVGQQLIWFAIVAKGSSVSKGLLPEDKPWERIIRIFSRESNLLVFVGILIAGVVLTIGSFIRWRATGFSLLDPEKSFRTALIAFVWIFTGLQSIFFHFLLGVILTRTESAVSKWQPYDVIDGARD